MTFTHGCKIRVRYISWKNTPYTLLGNLHDRGWVFFCFFALLSDKWIHFVQRRGRLYTTPLHRKKHNWAECISLGGVCVENFLCGRHYMDTQVRSSHICRLKLGSLQSWIQRSAKEATNGLLSDWKWNARRCSSPRPPVCDVIRPCASPVSECDWRETPWTSGRANISCVHGEAQGAHRLRTTRRLVNLHLRLLLMVSSFAAERPEPGCTPVFCFSHKVSHLVNGGGGRDAGGSPLPPCHCSVPSERAPLLLNPSNATCFLSLRGGGRPGPAALKLAFWTGRTFCWMVWGWKNHKFSVFSGRRKRASTVDRPTEQANSARRLSLQF